LIYGVPFSIFHSMFMGASFFNSIDPNRRYLYNVGIEYLPFVRWIPFHEFCIAYWIGLLTAINWSVIVFYAYLLLMYTSCSIEWSADMNVAKSKLNIYNDPDILIRQFLQGKLINQIYNQVAGKSVIPVTKIYLLVTHIIYMYAAVQYVGVIETQVYILIPASLVCIIMFEYMFFRISAGVQENSEALIQFWSASPIKLVRKFGKSCKSFRIQVGDFYYIDKGTFLEFQEIALENVINLLMGG